MDCIDLDFLEVLNGEFKALEGWREVGRSHGSRVSQKFPIF